MIKKIINKIMFLFLIAILFLSFIKLNSYAAIVEQEVLDNATVIPTIDENGELIQTTYMLNEIGDYIISGNVARQISFTCASTEENPIRIFITGDIQYFNMQEELGAAPLFSFYKKNSDNGDMYVEIIGVGENLPTIYENTSTNVFMYQQSTCNVFVKIKDFVIDATGGMNVINMQNNTGTKIIEMENVTVKNWDSTSSGYAVHLSSASGGSITAKFTDCKFLNNGGSTGGAIMTQGNSNKRTKLTLNNCIFEDNRNTKTNYATGNMAGSVNARTYSDIIMNGGYITRGKGYGNTTTGLLVPGGITIAANATGVLENVQITDNRGYGVFNVGTLTLKGNTNITGNDNGNIFLVTNSKVVLDTSYIGESGITVQDPPDFNTKRQVSTTQTTNYQEVFKNLNITSDNRDYTVRHDEANYLYLWKHEHDWVYENEANVIEANCTTDTDCYYYNNSIKLTLNTENMVYTGSEYDKASVENNITEITGEAAGEIYYIGTGITNYVESITPPIEEGTYKATILLGGKLAEKTFSILAQKRNLTVIKSWEDNNNSYNERPQNVIIELLQNNVVIQEIELNETNSWKYEFKDLLKLDSSKNEYIYTIREKNNVDGYYLREKNETEEIITLINTKYGKIKLNKEDLLTGEKLEGAVFRLERKKSDTEWEVIGEYTTDSSGIIVINNLTYGTYKLKETKAPEGYNFNLENAEVELEISEANANYELTVTNKAKPVLPATGGGRVQVILLIVAIILLILPNKLEKNSLKKE